MSREHDKDEDRSGGPTIFEMATDRATPGYDPVHQILTIMRQELHNSREEARQRHAWLRGILENIMTSLNTAQALFDAVGNAETRIEAQTAVLIQHGVAIKAIIAQLSSILTAPSPTQVQNVIDKLNNDLAGLESATAGLTAAEQVPVADPAPAPAAAPVAAAPAQDAAPVAAAPAPDAAPVAAAPAPDAAPAAPAPDAGAPAPDAPKTA